jgi:hypothetical protein
MLGLKRGYINEFKLLMHHLSSLLDKLCIALRSGHVLLSLIPFTPSLSEKGKPFCIDMTYEASPPLL